jgi:branched-chain amino acid transport system ATP-binding protein
VPAASGQRPAWFRSRRLIGADCAALVEAAAADHGLTGVLTQPASSLPQALRKQLDLAIALLQQPRLLLLDEPTAGVGSEDLASIESTLVRPRRDNRARAILVTSHDVDLISRIADTLMVMVQGRRIAYGPVAQVMQDPEVRRAYLGMERV